MCFLVGTPAKPETGNNLINKNDHINNNSLVIASSNDFVDSSRKNYPQFQSWKGKEANEALRAAWEVSSGDKDFILTMTAENGSWNLYLKHPVQNKNGTWDYSMGLNSKYHMPFIKKILAKEVNSKEIMQYHYNIYKERKGAYYGYYKRNKVKHLIKFV